MSKQEEEDAITYKVDEKKLFELIGEGAKDNIVQRKRPPTMSPQSISTVMTRQWNTEFQKLMDMEDSAEKFLQLSQLAQDFGYSAEALGKVIISEVNNPPGAKIIKNTSDGGFLGSDKYVIGGIQFRFAVDMTGVYHGDEFAMKAASHDIHGLMNYMACGIKEFHFPLMALIDYHGYRLIATSVLPISEKTICYGSPNGGVTVHCDNEEFNNSMKKAADLMNIKGHLVGLHPNGVGSKMLYSAGDLEGHIGTDKRWYLNEFSRYVPPEPPSPSVSRLGGVTTLFRLLRPELVAKYTSALNPDAYAGMGVHNSKPDRKDIQEVFEYLKETVLTATVKLLEDNMSQDEIISTIHREGINIRHLGLVRNAVSSPVLKQKIFHEIIARVLKQQLGRLLRRKATGWISDTPYRITIMNFINLFIGNSPNSQQFWENPVLKTEINFKFEEALTESELVPNFSLRSLVQLKPLLIRFKEITGIVFSKLASDELKKVSDSASEIFLFTYSDIDSLEAKIKQLNLIDYATGMAMFFNAKKTKGKEALRLLDLAEKKLSEAVLSITNFDAMYQLGLVYALKAKNTEKTETKDELFSKALELYDRIIKAKPQDFSSLMQKARMNIQRAKLKEKTSYRLDQAQLVFYKNAEDAVRKAIEINPTYVPSVSFLGEVLLGKSKYLKDDAQRKALEEARDWFEKAFTLSKNTHFKSAYKNGVVLVELAQIAKEKSAELYTEAAKKYQIAMKGNPKYEEKIFKSVKLDSPALWNFLLIASASESLFKRLCEAASTLERIDLTECQIGNEVPKLVKLVAHTPKLKRINFYRAEVNTDMLPSLFKQIPFIKELILTTIKLSDLQFGDIIGLLPNLEVIDLSLTGVTDASIEALCKKCSKITSVKLFGCKISDAGLRTLSLRYKESLTVLDISGADISDSGLPHASQCGKLQSLLLANLANITQPIFTKVSESLANLVSLDLTSCSGINELEPIANLHKKCPNLLRVRYPINDRNFSVMHYSAQRKLDFSITFNNTRQIPAIVQTWSAMSESGEGGVFTINYASKMGGNDVYELFTNYNHAWTRFTEQCQEYSGNYARMSFKFQRGINQASCSGFGSAMIPYKSESTKTHNQNINIMSYQGSDLTILGTKYGIKARNFNNNFKCEVFEEGKLLGSMERNTFMPNSKAEFLPGANITVLVHIFISQYYLMNTV